MNHFLQHMGAGKNAASKSVKSLLDKKSTRYDFDGDGECDVEEFAALCLTLINHHGGRACRHSGLGEAEGCAFREGAQGVAPYLQP